MKAIFLHSSLRWASRHVGTLGSRKSAARLKGELLRRSGRRGLLVVVKVVQSLRK